MDLYFHGRLCNGSLGMKQRLTGFVTSLILTLIAYYLTVHPKVFDSGNKSIIVIILGLAVLQAVVQLIFFIDLWKEKGIRWNLYVMLNTFSIMLIIIFFTIWIMNHLNYNMMPPAPPLD